MPARNCLTAGLNCAKKPGGGGGWGGRGLLPYKRLIGMCRWMGSHFDDWSDYNEGRIFNRFTRMGLHIFGFLG